jgi:hypothetical protein
VKFFSVKFDDKDFFEKRSISDHKN